MHHRQKRFSRRIASKKLSATDPKGEKPYLVFLIVAAPAGGVDRLKNTPQPFKMFKH
jgi:hypothetical protein